MYSSLCVWLYHEEMLLDQRMRPYLQTYHVVLRESYNIVEVRYRRIEVVKIGIRPVESLNEILFISDWVNIGTAC